MVRLGLPSAPVPPPFDVLAEPEEAAPAAHVDDDAPASAPCASLLLVDNLFWTLSYFALVGLLLAGCVLFVVALVRWEMNSWKYLLLALLILPFIAGIAGWVALLAGGVRRRTALPRPADLHPTPGLTDGNTRS
jgi:hypothetical protein